MIVLDTTVLVYAKGAAHSLRESCRNLVAAIADGRLAATTTVEVIQEFVHVRARRRGRADATALGLDYAALLSPLLSVTSDDLNDGLALFERVHYLDAFDAVLAAKAINVGAGTVVSADLAFASVAGITHVVPDRTGVQRLLAH